jgi:hypothetical protein
MAKGIPLTDEVKQRMAEGRRRAAEERRAQKLSPIKPQYEVVPGIEAAPIVWTVGQTEPEPPSPSPYDLFLLSLDSETRGLLSDAELRAIFEAGEKKALDEKRQRLQKQAADRALHQARAGAGLLPKEAIAEAAWRARMEEKVTFTPHLPESCYMEHFACPCLVVNGKPYPDGVEVTTTRGEYMSFREQVWRAQQAEMDFEGRSRLHHLRRERFASLDTRVSIV